RGHRVAEALAVLGPVDGVVVGADQLHAEALERAVLVQRLGEVERGLAAQGGQEGVGALTLDDLGHRPGQERLDVGGGGHLRVGHDRGGVGVDQYDLIPLLLEHASGLGAGVVELGRLPDHDRPGAEQQDLVDVGAPRHQAAAAIASTKRSNRYSESRGPGPASGWYWTVAPGTSRRVSPSTVRS